MNGSSAMTESLVTKTLVVVERMRGMLLDPHPGLAAWLASLGKEKERLDALFAPTIGQPIKPDPETVAIELDRLALDQTGPERGELVELAARIRLHSVTARSLARIAETRMAEIREAAVTEVPR